MNKKSFFQQLKRPKDWWLFTVYFFTTVSIAGAIGVLFIEYTGTPFAYFAYALFALAGCTLTYSVYTFVLYFPPFKRKLIDRLHTWKFTSKLLQNYGFRTVIFSAFSLALSIAYAAYNVVVALLFKTVWYGALATYYVLLVALRAGIALYHGKRRGKERDGLLELKKYRNCGILLIVTILALSFAILKMVSENAFFEHAGWTIYAAAAYSFYKIISASVHFFKANRQQDYTVRALRNINLADGAVSILALQTSMFHAFGDGSLPTGIANSITGALVCLLVFTLGVSMILSANKTIQQSNERKK